MTYSTGTSSNMADWSKRTARSGMPKGGSEELMEQENQQYVEQMSAKVSRLKNLAFDIEEETHEQNRFLSGLGLDFGSSEGLLSGSYKRMNTMVSSGKGNRKLMCSITIGLVISFIVLYYIVAKIRSG